MCGFFCFIKERRGRSDRVLQALFVFQEQRNISKLSTYLFFFGSFLTFV